MLGTRNVVDAALENGVSTFIMFSTDKAVNPTNVMGATKRAEAYCQTIDLSSQTTRFKTGRFGNVLGSNGSVVPRFQEQIAAGGPVTVTHPNIVRFFMTILEAVRLVLHASAHSLHARTDRGKIIVLDMGDPVRIVDLAERMIRLTGFKPNVDIEIVFSGLRPGEKLYEELFDPSEAQDATTEGRLRRRQSEGRGWHLPDAEAGGHRGRCASRGRSAYSGTPAPYRSRIQERHGRSEGRSAGDLT